MDKDFAATLKNSRLEAGFSQKDICDKLGVKQATFSAWETGRAEPSLDMLLKLCQLYNICDVLTAFGYRNNSQGDSLLLNPNEIDLVKNYRLLDNYGKELTDLIIKKEFERCGKIIAGSGNQKPSISA